MNEVQFAEPGEIAAPPPRSGRRDPLRRWTLVIIVVCVVLFGWTVIADRLTPYTSDASVRAFVVRMVPEVSGKVIEVAVHDNQIVRTGDLLYRIDPAPFRIAVERAEAKLAAAGQAVGASTAAVDEAQAQLVQASRSETTFASRPPGSSSWCALASMQRRKATRRGRSWTRPRRRCSVPRPRWSRRARRLAPKAPTTADPRSACRARAGTPRSRPDHPARTRRRCGKQPAAQHRAVRGRGPARVDLP
jgi:biotin/lipoyl-binding protein